MTLSFTPPHRFIPAHKEHYYGRWWTDRLTGKVLHAVIPAILEQAMADLAAKHYAPQTIVHYLKFLRQVFRWAIGRAVIEKSPFAASSSPRYAHGEHPFFHSKMRQDCARRSVNRMIPGSGSPFSRA
jgi:site-specific recombinase XerD